MFAYLEISGKADTVFGKTTGEVKLMAKKKSGKRGRNGINSVKRIRNAPKKKKPPVKHNGVTMIARRG